MADKGVIPSGSMSVNDVLDDDDQGTTSTDDTKDTKDDAKDTPFLGKYKTREEAEKGMTEKEKVIARQGEELGNLRKQTAELTKTLEQLKGKAGKDKGGKDTDAKTNPLGAIVEEFGNLDFYGDDSAAKRAAALMQKAIDTTASLVKEETLKTADSQFRSILQEKDTDAVKAKFMEQNPQFAELQASGAFQALKSKNPLHDDFSAYYAHQTEQQSAQIAELQKALDEAKKIANLAGGDEATSRVFTKPGGDLRQPKGKPKTLAEKKNSALEAMRRARGG